MSNDYFDRDGKPMPADWWSSTHGNGYGHWRTSRRVARTTVGDIEVSTIWLGLDHRWGAMPGPPIIFETMTFGDRWRNELDRYSTEEEALRGHLAVLDRLRAGKPPFARLDEDDE